MRARDLAGRRQVRREIQNVVCLPFPPSGDLAAREAAREAAGGARHDASTSTREVEGGGARRSTRVTLGAQRTLSAVTRSTTTFRREVSFRRFLPACPHLGWADRSSKTSRWVESAKRRKKKQRSKARELKMMRCDSPSWSRLPNYLVPTTTGAGSASVLRGCHTATRACLRKRRARPAARKPSTEAGGRASRTDTSAARREPARANVRALGRRFRESDSGLAGRRSAPLSVSEGGTRTPPSPRTRRAGGHDVPPPAPPPPRTRATPRSPCATCAPTWNRARGTWRPEPLTRARRRGSGS